MTGRHRRGLPWHRRAATSGEAARLMLAALTDAIAYRRERAARWCPECEHAPDNACPEHVADLEAAEAYDAMTHVLIEFAQQDNKKG